MFRSLKWEDWTGVALGAWVLVSPWVLGFSDHSAAVMNALTMGTVLVLVEFLDLEVHEPAEEWLALAAGLWLMLSPLVLGFANVPFAAVNAAISGLAAVVLAGWALSPMDERIGHWWHDHVAGH